MADTDMEAQTRKGWGAKSIQVSPKGNNMECPVPSAQEFNENMLNE